MKCRCTHHLGTHRDNDVPYATIVLDDSCRVAGCDCTGFVTPATVARYDRMISGLARWPA